ncbi:MAG: cobalamin biosynthesis central domain-containing protein [Lachnospiraceae bacterium]|nr:cobalamin biosynthesis central domain-containing protein [Lachnospiraceae bacterium]
MKRKSVRIYSFTGTGSHLALNLAEKLKQEGYVCTGYTVARFAEDKRLQRLNDGWKQEIGASWGEHALVFIGAAGIAIRAIAPFVKDKFTDPPVIVLDEKGTFAIPLLSGHVGGGVTLAKVLAEYTGGRAVITTATDVQKKFAADVFAMENGLVITDREEAKKISAGILEKKNTGIFSEFPLLGDIPEELTICGSEEQLEGCCGKIVICEKKTQK